MMRVLTGTSVVLAKTMSATPEGRGSRFFIVGLVEIGIVTVEGPEPAADEIKKSEHDDGDDVASEHLIPPAPGGRFRQKRQYRHRSALFKKHRNLHVFHQLDARYN